MHVNLNAGFDYAEVGIRAKQLKWKEIKNQMMKYTSNLVSDTGLIATSLTVKSLTGGIEVDIPLCPSVPELE